MAERRAGRVLTFYSFKGGTGRSMALANIATTIAQRNGGNRVLAVDWDLEAPGLHRYFRPYLKVFGPGDRDSEIESKPGLVEFLAAARQRTESLEPGLGRSQLVSAAFEPVSLEKYVIPTDHPQLFLMKAGAFDAGRAYQAAINTFDWEGLFKKQPMFFGALADYLASQFDYVLIDSRTGYTDISGICTSLLPDTLVVVFTPNRQSILGAASMVRQAVTYRANSDDLRPLRTFPLASRVELSELRLNDSWRFGDQSEEIPGYQPEFEGLFNELYGIEGCNLTSYFDEAQVPYVPFYAFGEKVAVRSEESATVRLSRSYTLLTDMIQSQSPAWEFTRNERASLERSDSDPIPALPWDREWMDVQRSGAMRELEGRPTFGSIEIRFSLSRVKASTSRRQLLDTIRAVEPDMASPIPQASGDGIFRLVDARVFDYWSLRENGDFFRLSSFPSDAPDTINANRLLGHIADAVLLCRRLYLRMGITPRAEVRFLVAFLGLRGWKLILPAHSPSVVTTHANQEEYEIEMVVGRIEGDLVQHLRALAAPLLEVFEFTSFTDKQYEDVAEGALLTANSKFGMPGA